MSDTFVPADLLWPHETVNHLACYSAIGRIVVQWGQLEDHFSANIFTLHRNLGGNKLQERPPGGFGKRSIFGSVAFEKYRLWSPFVTTRSRLQPT